MGAASGFAQQSAAGAAHPVAGLPPPQRPGFVSAAAASGTGKRKGEFAGGPGGTPSYSNENAAADANEPMQGGPRRRVQGFVPPNRVGGGPVPGYMSKALQAQGQAPNDGAAQGVPAVGCTACCCVVPHDASSA